MNFELVILTPLVLTPSFEGFSPHSGEFTLQSVNARLRISKEGPHMTIIQGLSEVVGDVSGWFLPVRREFVPVLRKQRIDGRTRTVFYAASIACAMIGSVIPLTAWSADLPSPAPIKPRKVVAAGVGYENAETSTITVKTYDAENGEILSEETYDLNVREDTASAGNQPSERIFAGGVGPGVDGLSVFTLRVYDATTGQFLWEGLLNLTAGDQESGSTHRVAAHLVARQATVIRVNDRGAIDGQPQFFLRAVDPVTGQLVWSDHFSAGTGRLARTEHVNMAIVGQTEGLMAPSQQIEFRVRMTDNRGRQILWEDTIEPAMEETDVVAGRDDAAEILPAWRGAELEEMKEEAI